MQAKVKDGAGRAKIEMPVEKRRAHWEKATASRDDAKDALLMVQSSGHHCCKDIRTAQSTYFTLT